MPVKKAPVYEYSEKQRKDFSDLIVRYKPLIYSAISKTWYIRNDERDDYFQEAVAYAWERYHVFDWTKGDFAGWLYQTTLWAIGCYRAYLRRYYDRNVSCEEQSQFPEIADVPYEEEHIKGLKAAIESLPGKKREVVEMFLNGEEFKERALSEGRQKLYYVTIFSRARKFILDNRGRFFEGISVDDRKLTVVPNGRTNELDPKSKKIDMYDMDGNYIKSFPSIQEAGRQGFDIANVSYCIRGGRLSHAGYRWAFHGEPLIKRPYKAKQEYVRSRKAILQYTLTGELVARHECMCDAKKLGFGMTGMKRAARGEIRQHKGFVFKFEE